MATRAQLLANADNAQKSTGPKSDRGKRRSSRNAVRHGLAGKGVCLLPDDDRRRDERLAAWAADEPPRTGREAELLWLAATEFTRIESGHRQQSAVLRKRMREAIPEWDRARHAEVKRLLARPDAESIRALKQSSLGCRELIRRWRSYLEALDSKHSWTPSVMNGVLALRGDMPAGERARLDERNATAAANPPGSATGDEAYSELRRWALVQVRKLKVRRDRLEAEVDGPDRAEAPLRAGFDDTPEGANRRRYLTASDLTMHRAFRALDQIRKEQRNEPNDANGCGKLTNVVSASATITQTPSPEPLAPEEPAPAIEVTPPASATAEPEAAIHPVADLMLTIHAPNGEAPLPPARNEPNNASLSAANFNDDQADRSGVHVPAAAAAVPSTTPAAPTKPSRRDRRQGISGGATPARNEPNGASAVLAMNKTRETVRPGLRMAMFAILLFGLTAGSLGPNARGGVNTHEQQAERFTRAGRVG